MKRMIKQTLILVIALGLLQSHMVIAMDLPVITQNVSGDSLTALYKDDSESYFYVRGAKDINPNEALVTLKQLLNSDGFRTVKRSAYQLDWSDPDWAGKDWSDQDWQKNLYKLIHGVQSPEEARMIEEAKAQLIKGNKEGGKLSSSSLRILMNYHRYDKNKYSLDELSARLTDAKNVIKSFVLSDDNRMYNQENFVKKSGLLNRLFTYAKLQHIIVEKQLTHVRLPLKVLRIKNAQTKEYVTAENALKIVDNDLKVCLHDDFTFSIQFMSTAYQMEIFASKEKKEGKGLSKAAMEELIILCNEAPFDIGYDNIFWDAHGNAIIIDTEYKGAQVHDCGKLVRYPVDPNRS